MSKLIKRIVVVVSIIVMAVSIAGCGRGASAVQEPVSIREPQPTFTPTPPPGADSQVVTDASSGAVTDSAAPDSEQAGSEQAGSEQTGNEQTEGASDAPAALSAPAADDLPAADTSSAESVAAAPAGTVSGQVVVNTPLVNGRAGPSTDYDVVGIVGRGEEYDIIGRNAAGDWWNVCCYEEQEFWVINELVDTVGAVDVSSVPVTELGSSSAPLGTTAASTDNVADAGTNSSESTPADTPAAQAPTAASTPTAPPPTLASAAATGEFAFDLKLQEQFAETTLVRIYAYVYNQDVQALSGYSVLVTKDGVELPVSETSFGPQAGFTWPVAEPRQRFQNLEVEFPDEEPAGTWTVQLIDSSGSPAGPVATFELTANDPQQELYVRYEQR